MSDSKQKGWLDSIKELFPGVLNSQEIKKEKENEVRREGLVDAMSDFFQSCQDKSNDQACIQLAWGILASTRGNAMSGLVTELYDNEARIFAHMLQEKGKIRKSDVPLFIDAAEKGLQQLGRETVNDFFMGRQTPPDFS